MRANHASRLAAVSTSAYSLGGRCDVLSTKLALQESADGGVGVSLTRWRCVRAAGSILVGFCVPAVGPSDVSELSSNSHRTLICALWRPPTAAVTVAESSPHVPRAEVALAALASPTIVHARRMFVIGLPTALGSVSPLRA